MNDLILPHWLIGLTHTVVIVVFVVGLLCFFVRKTLIKQIMGLKLMLQSISLGLIFTGWQNNNLNLAQSLVISALILEAVVIGLALTMIVHIAKHPVEDPGIFSHLLRRKRDEDG